jgi:hypothetical protein
MELNLLSLRRYAISNRVEIMFADASSNHACVINAKGNVQVPGEDKAIRAEDVLSSAQSFAIVGKGKTQQLDRAQMAQTVARSGGGASRHHDDEDDE